MMDRHPVPTKRRRLFEGLIRAIDLVTYATVFAGGIYASVFSPGTLTAELGSYGWLAGVWIALLLSGGLAGFLGRVTRRWMIEVPATVLSFFGIAIFVVMLLPHLSSPLAIMGLAIVAVASLVMARRWAELQIFSTDPGDASFRGRLAQALRRRTQDFVPRHN